MSQLDQVETHFSGGPESPELEEYRPISPLVIIACLAGLASLLAVFHPLFWIVPVVAAVLAVCAIVQVSAPHSRFGGRFAAVATLCLAALVGAYAPARALSRERVLYAQAEVQVKKWVLLVQQGRYQEAHQAALVPSERFQGPGKLADHYLPVPKKKRPEPTSALDVPTDPDEMMPDNSQKLAAFIHEDFIKKLIDFGPQASVAHVQNISISNAHGSVKVRQRFRVSGMQDGQPQSVEFTIAATRWEGRGHADWQCADFNEVE